MEKEILSTVKRAGRVSLATIIAGLVMHITGDQKWLLLAPVISAVGKFLRECFNLPYLPF